MIALLQRVANARVKVAGNTVGAIDQGVLAFIGVERDDTAAQAQRLAQRVLAYRLFADAKGKMNLNVSQVNGGVLAISQFTLAADTNCGNRPSFTPAAPPTAGEALFNHFVAALQQNHSPVATGIFGADMEVSLVNDGPVTFWLQV